MTLAAGSRFGAYEIAGAIGSGAMGEVYRARDTKLGRDVAIKVLPELFAGDAERLARFEREAQALAALNHPHIAQIYAVQDGAIIMEFVEGDDLAARIARGPIRAADTLPLIRQIADALDAAHERGIVHRDLKPANIRIRPDGVVKVLDFGLATAIDPTGSVAKTVTGVTLPGVLMGTPSYMSPEQARGLAVGPQTDIWALGCIAFEMLTGRHAFPGETVSDTLVAILDRPPDWRDARLSPFERRLIGRCLEKDPKRRFHDAGDICLAIDDATGGQGGAPRRRSPFRVPLVAAIAAVALGVGLLAGYLGFRGLSAPAVRISRLAIPLAAGDDLQLQRCPTFALSPDGRQIAFIARRGGRPQLFLQQLNGLDAHPVRGGEDALDTVVFSPDGRWIAFFADREMRKVPVTGGAPTAVTPSRMCGADWTSADRIVWGNRDGIFDAPSSGGERHQIILADRRADELAMYTPQLLPDGKTYLFTLSSGADMRIVAQRAGSVERVGIIERGHDAVYVQGRLVYGDSGSIFAVPFDPSTLKITGVPVPIVDGVAQLEGGVSHVSVSRDGGVLAYAPGGVLDEPVQKILAIGAARPAQPLAVPQGTYSSARMSPDGTKLAIDKFTGGKSDVWIYDLVRGTMTALTYDGDNRAPIWDPGGQRVFYSSDRDGSGADIYATRVDGAGSDVRITSTDQIEVPGSVSRDGKWLAYAQLTDSNRWRILALPLGAPGATPREYAPARFDQRSPAISPDGRWLAYVSAEVGRGEIFVGTFPDPGPRLQVSTGSGRLPVWSRDGHQLFYRNATQIMAVEVSAERALNVSRPREVLDDKGQTEGLDLAPDGRFIAVSARPPRQPMTRLNVLLDWADRE